MNPFFKQCLERKTIIKFKEAVYLVEREIKEGQKDVKDAQEFLRLNKVKGATVFAYYSIFHSARALLYQKGYRERSHSGLRIAIKCLYEEAGFLYEGWAEDFRHCMKLREDADYKGVYSKETAEEVIKSAQRFLKTTHEILKPSLNSK